MDARRRPERRRKEWSELAAANSWYAEQCRIRGIPREEALEWWEGLTPTARIRRWKNWLKGSQEATFDHDQAFNRLCADVARTLEVGANITRYARGENGEL